MQKQNWDEFRHVLDALEATWPAAQKQDIGPWIIRNGKGGGKRVSAATPKQDWRVADIPQAEDAMQAFDQNPLFMITPADQDLDNALMDAGYEVIDPVNIYATPIELLTHERPPKISMFSVWPPLAIQQDIWANAGINDARLDIMKRVTSPKTTILARWNDHPAGVGFAATHGVEAYVHAVEIRAHQRKQGVASWLMKQAAFWAREQGAVRLNVACTKANEGANALYRSIGMQVVGEYHYRVKG